MEVSFHIGVTGSRHGWSAHQINTLQSLLDQIPYAPSAVCGHHGCCRGGDTTAHQIFRERGYRIIGHPPDTPSWLMSQDLVNDLDETRPPKPYNDRNMDIVSEVAILFGGPKLPRYLQGRKQKSGTWNTLEMGIKRGVMVYVSMPLPWETAKTESPFFTN